MKKILLLFVLLAGTVGLYGQNRSDSAILGSWEVKKFVWASPTKEEKEELPRFEHFFVGSIVTFEKNGKLKFETRSGDNELRAVFFSEDLANIYWQLDTSGRVINLYNTIKRSNKDLLGTIEIMEKDGNVVFHPLETPLYFLVEKKSIAKNGQQ